MWTEQDLKTIEGNLAKISGYIYGYSCKSNTIKGEGKGLDV